MLFAGRTKLNLGAINKYKRKQPILNFSVELYQMRAENNFEFSEVNEFESVRESSEATEGSLLC